MPNDAQPQVTVRNIPQSEYNQNYVPPSGGGLKGSFQQHKWLWLGGGIIGLFLLYILWNYWNNQNQAASAQNASMGLGVGTGNSSPDQLWGSQLDADYQQLISSMNTNSGLLQQILNSVQNPSSNPPNNPPSTTPPTLLPKGTRFKAGAGSPQRIYYELPGSSSWLPLEGAFGSGVTEYLPTSMWGPISGPGGWGSPNAPKTGQYYISPTPGSFVPITAAK